MSKDQQIIDACVRGDLAAVIRLTENLEHGQIDSILGKISKSRVTPLNAACQAGQLEIVQFLVTKRDANIIHALHFALTPEIIDFLVAYGADIDFSEGSHTPLYRACFAGNLAAAKSLIFYGAKTQVVDQEGSSLLHSCAHSKNAVDIAEYLLSIALAAEEPPWDLNQANCVGNTPLHQACGALQPDYVIYLTFKGADVNRPNYALLTPKENVLASWKEGSFVLKELENSDNEDERNMAESIKGILSFIGTWNQKGQFVQELSYFADEQYLTSDILFQFYCSGELPPSPADLQELG